MSIKRMIALQLADTVQSAAAAVLVGAAPKPDGHGIPHLHQLLHRASHRWLVMTCLLASAPQRRFRGLCYAQVQAERLHLMELASIFVTPKAKPSRLVSTGTMGSQ